MNMRTMPKWHDVAAVAAARLRGERDERVNESGQAPEPPENARRASRAPGPRARPEEERELLHDDGDVERAEREAHAPGVNALKTRSVAPSAPA